VQGVEAIVLSIPFGRYLDLANLFDEVPADVAVISWSILRCSQQMRQGRMCDVEQAAHIDGQHPLPFLDVCSDDRPDEHEAGIVDQMSIRPNRLTTF
jgi:hypothetical protein